MSRIANERKSRFVLHIEERDLATVGILDALNGIAAHSEIFYYFSKEELEMLISN